MGEVNLQFDSVWEQPSGVPAPVNQFAIVQGPNIGSMPAPLYEFHFGHVSPPMVTNDHDLAVFSQMAVNKLPIHRLGHFELSIEVMRQLHEVLGNVISAYESAAMPEN